MDVEKSKDEIPVSTGLNHGLGTGQSQFDLAAALLGTYAIGFYRNLGKAAVFLSPGKSEPCCRI